MQYMQFLNSYSALIVAKLKVLVLAYINNCHMQNLGATHHPSISASGWGISIHKRNAFNTFYLLNREDTRP